MTYIYIYIYISGEKGTIILYKNIICFCSFVIITKCTKKWSEGEGRRWLSLHAHGDNSVVYL